MLHDCIYQFLRLFYHSRFKPTQLEMTWAQFATPVIDVVLVLPLILRLARNISGFTNDARMRLKSKPGINRREHATLSSKVGCFCPILIWPKFRMVQFRDENHLKDVPRFDLKYSGFSDSGI